MDSRSDLRERPPSGEHEWPNNGEINERLRVNLLELAERAEAEGRDEFAVPAVHQAHGERALRFRAFADAG
jgi:hypothetical protein